MATSALVAFLSLPSLAAPESAADIRSRQITNAGRKPNPASTAAFDQPSQLQSILAKPSKPSVVPECQPARDRCPPVPPRFVRKKDSECPYEKGTLQSKLVLFIYPLWVVMGTVRSGYFFPLSRVVPFK